MIAVHHMHSRMQLSHTHACTHPHTHMHTQVTGGQKTYTMNTQVTKTYTYYEHTGDGWTGNPAENLYSEYRLSGRCAQVRVLHIHMGNTCRKNTWK